MSIDEIKQHLEDCNDYYCSPGTKVSDSIVAKLRSQEVRLQAAEAVIEFATDLAQFDENKEYEIFEDLVEAYRAAGKGDTK